MKNFLSKKSLIGIGLACVLLTGVGLANGIGHVYADTAPRGNIVTVTGDGAITVKPDIGYLSVGVETSDKDAKKAQELNKAAMDRVIKALKGKGLADKDIKTTSYSMWKGVDYNKAQTEQIETYHVSNRVEVTITQLDQTGTLIDLCVAAGGNVSDGVRFTVKDKNAFYQQALQAAMSQAQSKAAGIMGTFGAKPDKPWRVTEVPQYEGPVVYAAAMAKEMDSASATPIQPGEMEIKAQVTVEYGY